MENSYVGISLDDFMKLYKGDFRIVQNNEKNFIVTRDFKPERLNLTLENNIIVKVTTG